MTLLLSSDPYGPRDDERLLAELNQLVHFHLNGSQIYQRIVGDWHDARRLADLPFIHVGLFKQLDIRTCHDDLTHQRTLLSSSTSGVSSKIVLDEKSSKLQAESSKKILGSFIGYNKRPLLVIDSVRSLSQRITMSARIAASMSLKPFASELCFILEDAENPRSMNWMKLEEVLARNDEILVYGFSWILWLAWGKPAFPESVRNLLKGKKIIFVHSGGWKKLEKSKISHQDFSALLLNDLHPDSKVVDYYGMVEQTGVVYPLCEKGYRHPPVWADVFVRDSYTLEPLTGGIGQLQLINPLAWGSPYHSVYTEDMAIVEAGPCECGRSGKRFRLIGRLPKAENRGCSNV